MSVTIEDSLRGHFLRSIRRRVEAKKLADGMVRIPVDDAKLLLEIVELLDSEVRELRARPHDVRPSYAMREIVLDMAISAMHEVHPGLIDEVGGIDMAIRAAARAQPSMPLMTAIWNDGYSHGCDGTYSPIGDVHKGEPESLVETEVLRVLDAWGKARVSVTITDEPGRAYMVDGRMIYSPPVESLGLSAGGERTVRLPDPNNMHGACDGFGGEDPIPRPIGDLGTWHDLDADEPPDHR